MNKVLYLVDMNAFYISCEAAKDSTLNKVPACVGGDPKNRTGIVLTSNYIARSYGVKTAMTISEALNLCPEMRILKPNHALYSETSEKIMNLLGEYTPKIEINSIDEAWLDMTSIDLIYKKSHKKIAQDIHDKIKEKFSISCSIGIGGNKFLSKMASEYKKPDGIFWLKRGLIKDYLWQLPIEKMYGCGKKTKEKFKKYGILTVGDLANSDIVFIRNNFGKIGESLYLCSNAMTKDELNNETKTKSISKEKTLSKDTSSKSVLLEKIKKLSNIIGEKINNKRFSFQTVYITIKYNDFTKITRQKKISLTNDTNIIFDTSKNILKDIKLKKPVRLIGVGVCDLCDDTVKQLSLFNEVRKNEEIKYLINDINCKYKKRIIKKGYE